jgi:RNA polymerase sigma factor (sigma-70 family)
MTARTAAMTDSDLEQAFATLLRDNHAALSRLARHYAGADDWQDLLQEMHLQLWRGFPGFDGRAQLATWVYRVALNTALSDRRRLRPPHQALETVAERGDSGEPRDPIGVLEAFLATLEPVQRAVLLLDLEGLEREQIADVLGLSPNAVAVRMTRLRQAFEARFLEN